MMLGKTDYDKSTESIGKEIDLDELIETKPDKIYFNPRLRILYGLALVCLGSPFLVLGFIALFKNFWDNTFTEALLGVFLILLGSSAIIGINLIRNKPLSQHGFFPPSFLIIFGIFILIMSPLLYFDINIDIKLTLFGLAFGCACIYLGFKRKRS